MIPGTLRPALVASVLALVAACVQLERTPAPTPAMQADVARLVAAATRLTTAWPWQGEIAEVAQVARHGADVAPALVAQLRYGPEAQWGAGDWNLHVEQQVALALCRIFSVAPESGRTVFGVRSPDAQNRQVREYWSARVARARAAGDGR